jgi:hypothetical protein
MKTQYKLCLIEAAYQTNLPEGWHVILNRMSGKLTAKLNCIIQKNDAKWSQAENQNALPELKIRLHEEICMMGRRPDRTRREHESSSVKMIANIHTMLDRGKMLPDAHNGLAFHYASNDGRRLVLTAHAFPSAYDGSPLPVQASVVH